MFMFALAGISGAFTSMALWTRNKAKLTPTSLQLSHAFLKYANESHNRHPQIHIARTEGDSNSSGHPLGLL